MSRDILLRAATALIASLLGANAGADIVLDVALGRAHQSGFLQTPTGGGIGTATTGRPALAELDLENDLSARVGLTVTKGNWFAAASYEHFEVSSSAVISSPLIVQGRSFANGASLASEMSFHEMALVGGRIWRDGVRDWWVGLRLGATDFSLAMDSAALVSPVDRAYHVIDVGFTGGVAWSLNERWAARLEFLVSPQHERFAARARADAHLVYRLGQADLVAGVRVERFEYDDSYKQALPNRLDMDRVIPRIGVAWHFHR